MPRYFSEIDIEALFRDGAASFRLDAQTAAVLCEAARSADWSMPDLPDDFDLPEFCPAKPMARLEDVALSRVRLALSGVLADPVLTAPFAGFGSLSVNQVEIFNGAIDTGWHHDGLAGKRGHAGEYFLLCYIDPLGQGAWSEDWGGAFEFGERVLGGNWVHEIGAPEKAQAIFPNHRTCVLGWNGNPRIVHRSAPLKAAVDRFVVAASVRFSGSASR